MVKKKLKLQHVSIVNTVDLGEINKKVYQADPPWSLLRPIEDLKGLFYGQKMVKKILIHTKCFFNEFCRSRWDKQKRISGRPILVTPSTLKDDLKRTFMFKERSKKLFLNTTFYWKIAPWRNFPYAVYFVRP